MKFTKRAATQYPKQPTLMLSKNKPFDALDRKTKFVNVNLGSEDTTMLQASQGGHAGQPPLSPSHITSKNFQNGHSEIASVTMYKYNIQSARNEVNSANTWSASPMHAESSSLPYTVLATEDTGEAHTLRAIAFQDMPQSDTPIQTSATNLSIGESPLPLPEIVNQSRSKPMSKYNGKNGEVERKRTKDKSKTQTIEEMGEGQNDSVPLMVVLLWCCWLLANLVWVLL